MSAKQIISGFMYSSPKTLACTDFDKRHNLAIVLCSVCRRPIMKTTIGVAMLIEEGCVSLPLCARCSHYTCKVCGYVFGKNKDVLRRLEQSEGVCSMCFIEQRTVWPDVWRVRLALMAVKQLYHSEFALSKAAQVEGVRLSSSHISQAASKKRGKQEREEIEDEK